MISMIPVAGCITRYNPEITEKKNLLVVEGMITDQPGTYSIRLSLSQPLGEKETRIPVTGAAVFVGDDADNIYYFYEVQPGLYKSDSTRFTGVIGRKYYLSVRTLWSAMQNYNYRSSLSELKPVPHIDSLYYEKIVTGINEFNRPVEGAQIYLDAHDNGEDCRFFRWSFSETWEFMLHWDVPNHTCWRSENSYEIKLKNTSVLADNSIKKMPFHFIDNSTDRLSVEYSMLVSQYSISQDEYDYWEKVKNVTQNVGGLYDIVPASITGNMVCIEDPSQPVLGYFSVSAVSSKRIFIKDRFSGQQNFYASCVADTIYNVDPIPGLGQYVWILLTNNTPGNFYRVLTFTESCADCTTRGTLKKPGFWEDKKSTER